MDLFIPIAVYNTLVDISILLRKVVDPHQIDLPTFFNHPYLNNQCAHIISR